MFSLFMKKNCCELTDDKMNYVNSSIILKCKNKMETESTTAILWIWTHVDCRSVIILLHSIDYLFNIHLFCDINYCWSERWIIFSTFGWLGALEVHFWCQMKSCRIHFIIYFPFLIGRSELTEKKLLLISF